MIILVFILCTMAAIFGLILAIWAQDSIPRKINASLAKDYISQFENSPAAKYAIEQIVNNMAIEIINESRSKTLKTIDVYYTFSVDTYQVHGHTTSQYDADDVGITQSWSYDFCQHRYPNLESNAERIALAKVIAHNAVIQLRKKFPLDKSGSNDVSIYYSEQFNYGHIKIHYSATNLFYEELKSW